MNRFDSVLSQNRPATAFDPHEASINEIVVLKADRLCSGALRRIASEVFPRATIREVSRLAEARRWLSILAVDLLLAGTTMVDGDVGELLAQCDDEVHLPRRVLVVTGSRQPRVLERLLALPVTGIFDSADEKEPSLDLVLRQVADGQSYWSPTVLARLNAGLTVAHRACRDLTLTEQLVLSVIGDGSDDEAAAARLELTTSTIQSTRRSLHRKLGVQQKGELIRLAAQYGFVRFTTDSVVSPGFTQLLTEWQARRRQRPTEVG